MNCVYVRAASPKNCTCVFPRLCIQWNWIASLSWQLENNIRTASIMEILQEMSSQYVLYIPVALVIIVAILVFTFGFKSAEQPPFDKLTSEERKSSGKKKKIKEKVTIWAAQLFLSFLVSWLAQIPWNSFILVIINCQHMLTFYWILLW